MTTPTTPGQQRLHAIELSQSDAWNQWAKPLLQTQAVEIAGRILNADPTMPEAELRSLIAQRQGLITGLKSLAAAARALRPTKEAEMKASLVDRAADALGPDDNLTPDPFAEPPTGPKPTNVDLTPKLENPFASPVTRMPAPPTALPPSPP